MKRTKLLYLALFFLAMSAQAQDLKIHDNKKGKVGFVDANGNEIHSKDSYGNERWHEYDAGGNLIHKKVSSGSEWWYEYEYHQNKQIKKVTEYERF